MFRERAEREVVAIQMHPAITCEELYEWAGVPYTIGQQPHPAPFRFRDGHTFFYTGLGEWKVPHGTWLLRSPKTSDMDSVVFMQDEVFQRTYVAAEPTENGGAA